MAEENQTTSDQTDSQSLDILRRLWIFDGIIHYIPKELVENLLELV